MEKYRVEKALRINKCKGMPWDLGFRVFFCLKISPSGSSTCGVGDEFSGFVLSSAFFSLSLHSQKAGKLLSEGLKLVLGSLV